MRFLYNNPERKHLRQSLRNEASKPEVILWHYLKGKSFHGIKLRRQYGIGRYSMDFYRSAHRLAIEVDGSQH